MLRCSVGFESFHQSKWECLKATQLRNDSDREMTERRERERERRDTVADELHAEEGVVLQVSQEIGTAEESLED